MNVFIYYDFYDTLMIEHKSSLSYKLVIFKCTLISSVRRLPIVMGKSRELKSPYESGMLWSNVVCRRRSMEKKMSNINLKLSSENFNIKVLWCDCCSGSSIVKLNRIEVHEKGKQGKYRVSTEWIDYCTFHTSIGSKCK